MINQLKSIGLSDKQAKVYLAMLELGPSTILQISAKSGINRPTTYVQIEFLKKIGLVSTQTKGKKQLFIAEDPEHFANLIENEKRELDNKKENIAKILPELKTLFNLSGEKPQVRFFEGKEGLLSMQEDFLKSKDKLILSIASADDVLNLFPDHPKTYIEKRIKKKIKTKLIYTSSHGDFLKEKDKEVLRESKYVPSDKLPIDVDLTIYDDKVGVAALKGRISGAIIQHKEIANSFRSLFHLVWNSIS